MSRVFRFVEANRLRRARLNGLGLCGVCGLYPNVLTGRHSKETKYCQFCGSLGHRDRGNRLADIRMTIGRLNAYGWVCRCCGESDLYDLTLGHPRGVSGRRDRLEVYDLAGYKPPTNVKELSGSGFSRCLELLGFPQDRGYHTACMVCNWLQEHFDPCPCDRLGDLIRLRRRGNRLGPWTYASTMAERPWVIPWKTYRPSPDQTILTPNGPIVVEVADGG